MNTTLDDTYTYADGSTCTYGELLARAFNNSGFNTRYTSNSISLGGSEEDKRKFKCQSCNKKYHTQHGLDYHNKTKH